MYVLNGDSNFSKNRKIIFKQPTNFMQATILSWENGWVQISSEFSFFNNFVTGLKINFHACNQFYYKLGQF